MSIYKKKKKTLESLAVFVNGWDIVVSLAKNLVYLILLIK